ncbi:SdpI family protein [Anatilimnocola floriformis]|uniref:SdpI family protein n=1 Tax=Anatilimnocola floriformis TaxID=2948575 RepID=UPI0020C32FCC|nr:SdpI family protein [Anatilimnocola floriformis]
MDPVAIIVGASWSLAGLLCIGLAIPLVYKRVPRNAFYGVRFPESFQSDEAWFAINRYGGKRLIIWSIPTISSGIVSFFLPLQANPSLALALAFLPLVFVLIPAWESWRFARQYR